METVIGVYSEPLDLLLLPRLFEKLASLFYPLLEITDSALGWRNLKVRVTECSWREECGECPSTIIKALPPFTPSPAHRAIVNEHTLGTIELGLKDDLVMILAGRLACSALHDPIMDRTIRRATGSTLAFALTEKCLEWAIKKYRGNYILIPLQSIRVKDPGMVRESWTLLRVLHGIGAMDEFICYVTKNAAKEPGDGGRNVSFIKIINKIFREFSNIDRLLGHLRRFVSDKNNDVSEAWKLVSDSLKLVMSDNIHVYLSRVKKELVPLLAPIATIKINTLNKRKPIIVLWPEIKPKEDESQPTYLTIISAPGYPSAPNIARVLEAEGLIRIHSRNEYKNVFEGIVDLLSDPEDLALARINYRMGAGESPISYRRSTPSIHL